MAMVVRTNYSALNATRHLNKNQSGVAGSIEKLSSGFKVNRAADDAAGLAISEKMKAQIKALDVSVNNAEDGIGLIQTTEGYLDSIHSMLNRMVELSEKSANGIMQTGEYQTVSGSNVGDVKGGAIDSIGNTRGIKQTAETDRDSLQNEMNQLCAEIDRVAATANFNKVKLFTGNLATREYDRIRNEGVYRNSAEAIEQVTKQVDIAMTARAQEVSDAQQAMVDEFVNVNTAQTSLDIIKGDLMVLRSLDDALNARITANALAQKDDLIPGVSTFGVQAELDKFIKELSLVSGNGTKIESIAQLEAAYGSPKLGGFSYDVAKQVSGATTGFTETDPSTVSWTEIRTIVTEAITSANEQAATAQDKVAAALLKAKPVEQTYYDLLSEIYNTEAGKAGLKIEFDRATGDNTKYITSFSVDLSKLDTYKDWSNPANVGGKVFGEGLTLQIGETSNAADKLTVSVGRMHTDTIFANLTSPTTWKNSDGNNDVRIEINNASSVQGVIGYTIDISGQQRASAAAEALNSVINMVSAQRAELGAQQNRLDYTIDNLNTASENMQAANSRIRDTDMAKEMTKFTMQNVLLQAAQSMLSQANAQPQNVLSLLR